MDSAVKMNMLQLSVISSACEYSDSSQKCKIARIKSNNRSSLDTQTFDDYMDALNDLSLKKLTHGTPAFMMIVTATGPAYRRKDGIYVVPLNRLKA